MPEVNRIRLASIWIFIIPILVLNLCLFVSINYHLLENTIFRVDQIGRSGFTIPYIDGGISISRTARTYPTYLLFKPGMLLTSILLIRYWILNNRVFQKIENETSKNKYFLYFGVASALFLIIHSLFLGINFETDIFKFLRRFVLLGFIIFEVIAQILLTKNLFSFKNELKKYINPLILKIKVVFVVIVLITTCIAFSILSFGDPSTGFKHTLEWNYFSFLLLYYLLSRLLWVGQKNQKF